MIYLLTIYLFNYQYIYIKLNNEYKRNRTVIKIGGGSMSTLHMK